MTDMDTEDMVAIMDGDVMTLIAGVDTEVDGMAAGARGGEEAIEVFIIIKQFVMKK